MGPRRTGLIGFFPEGQSKSRLPKSAQGVWGPLCAITLKAFERAPEKKNGKADTLTLCFFLRGRLLSQQQCFGFTADDEDPGRFENWPRSFDPP
jgi:hypothetical protein